MPFSLIPKLILPSLTDLTPELLAARGVRFLMLDFDNTIVPYTTNEPAEAMTALRRHGKCNARLYAVSTDYSCCPFFEELEVDRYFIPHASLIPEFVDRGIPEEKLCVTGIPVSERFLQKTDKREARERLHLPQEGKIALIMTGSMGFGNTKAIAEELLECAPDMHLVILGGNNEQAKAELRKILHPHAPSRRRQACRQR